MYTISGKTPEDYRKNKLEKWSEICDLSKVIDYRKLMSSESEMLTWKNMGLPADKLSMENGLVIKVFWLIMGFNLNI